MIAPVAPLVWTPARLPDGGRWRVLRLGYSLLGTTNHPAPPEATGLEVDKFDGAAVRRYLEHYIGMYRDAAGPGMIGESMLTIDCICGVMLGGHLAIRAGALRQTWRGSMQRAIMASPVCAALMDERALDGGWQGIECRTDGRT